MADGGSKVESFVRCKVVSNISEDKASDLFNVSIEALQVIGRTRRSDLFNGVFHLCVSCQGKSALLH